MIITSCSAYITSIIKNFTQISRPSYELTETTYNTYSFPSGHAHGSMTFWFYSSLMLKKKMIFILGIIIIVLVSISRVYLNVHYISDVLFGIALGLATVVGFIVFEPLLTRYSRTWCFYKKIFFATIPLLFLILHSSLMYNIDIQSLKLSSALFGMLLGSVLENKYIRFSTRTTINMKIFRIILGLSISFLAYYGLNFVLQTNMATVFLTAFLGGFTVIFITPLIFIKLEGNTH